MAKHAKLSASGSPAWMACPGKPNAEEDLVRNPNYRNSYANEGTAAHYVLENCLQNEVTADFYAGNLITIDDDGDAEWTDCQPNGETNFLVDEEMVNNVNGSLDRLQELGPLSRWAAETQVDFSAWVPEGFGTCDAILLDGTTLYVRDLKYGKGVRVDAQDNSQLRLYALGAVEEYAHIYDVETVDMGILQPRMDHYDNEVMSLELLLQWADEVLAPAAELAMTEDAPRIPGEKQCRFCDAAGTCPELAAKALATACEDFDNLDEVEDLELKETGALSLDQVGALLPIVPMIDKWIRSLEGVAIDAIKTGQQVPGFKLVEGRSLRKWDDEEVAEKFLRRTRKLKLDEVYTKKLISPAQAEKIIPNAKKDDRLQKLIVRPAGKPTLAPESDKRKALDFTPDDFENLDNEEM